MTWAARLLAGFLGLPRWVHLALAGAALFFLWLRFHDAGVIRDHESEVAAAVATRSAAASEAAAATVSETKSEVEQTNAQARDAAARRPDDPLRAGLDRLRQQQGADKPAAR